MHEIAEKGVAAHFNYKQQSLGKNFTFGGKDLEEWANWMKEIFTSENVGDEDVQQLLESFKLNLYQQEIQVFTPKVNCVFYQLNPLQLTLLSRFIQLSVCIVLALK